ncbi:uncharacterized protein METZ01_LOCUS155300 [marine metagenome]|uniref:Uncharacterized protein n=1 Tax=marine metagenome TaxID=408172 RepID=A0A382ALR4_9ZZZZ
MRLSLSGEHTGDEYALSTAVGSETGDGGLPMGSLLNEFIEAVCSQDESGIAQGRENIMRELGEAAMVDTAAVIAAFNGYPRAADATGIPLEDYKEEATEDMRTVLGLDSLNRSKRNQQD